MLNVAGREIPVFVEGFGDVAPFDGMSIAERRARPATQRRPGASKVVPDLRTALVECGVRDGATLSFHHHLRNGDQVMNTVLAEAAQLGLRNLSIAPSSIFPVHAPLVELIKRGVITRIYTAYASGPVADAIAAGLLEQPAVLQTHGGRARAIESAELQIDVAFVAAPTADDYGNICSVTGPAACGPLGYATADAQFAKHVVAVTENLVPYPAYPVEISQEHVDLVVCVPTIGDATRILSGTTTVTEDSCGLDIASMAARVTEAAGLLRDGFSFQTGAGGISLAVARYIQEAMQKKKIMGSFASGGITGQIVEMLERGLFRTLFDVQCFDLRAVQSYRDHTAHQRMSSSLYANPASRGAVVDRLDVMILGASEIDLDFNVNVTTASDGRLIGGSGGHSDTAAGAKLSIVTTRLNARANPKITERVRTLTTPGSTIDVVVTEAGVAVNPRRPDLIEALTQARIPLLSISRLHDLSLMAAGRTKAEQPATDQDNRIVALQQYRDGTIIDVLRAATHGP
ncbi:citrate lyase subunit alpha [Paraburkholderia susongensis]|uniref:Citrate lyase alpha chain n=1 Tax=Paraburkholderia susongensis TaxID=1515439 RepID=A0A1X7M4M5_9BURK|nr:citrate lyase subunit alpha [Paraburkholderia susongensis]SMG60714.1 citrate lyase subunit alpha / citrate CoA-transferase [Paraburkholderia susongensis]